MIKSIIKEIFILILLCTAIVLVLGVLFYDYNPTSKIIPNKVAYQVPDNIKEELQETIENVENEPIQEVIVTYKVDASDLQHYQSAGSYAKGKINPFASLDQPTNNNVTANNTVTNTTTPGNTTNNSNGNSTVGNFFEKPGVK